MIILWLATYLLVIGAVGFALTAAILGPSRRRMIELFALSLALGCGAMPILLIWLSCVAGVKPTRGGIAVIGLLAIALIVVGHRAKRLPPIARPIMPKLNAADLILLPVIL